MHRPKISIRAMLAVVAFIALACVALVRANAIWASVMFSAALGVISFAVLAAIFRRGAKQAFWIGFALFGWLYLWMAHWPNGDFRSLPDQNWMLQNDGTASLGTTRFLAHAYIEWLPMVRKPPATTSAAGGFPPPPPVVFDYPALHEFTRVGHSLFIVILGFLGGIIAMQLYRTREGSAIDVAR